MLLRFERIQQRHYGWIDVYTPGFLSVLHASKTQRTSGMTVVLFWRVVGRPSQVTVNAAVDIGEVLARIRSARVLAPPGVRPLRLHEMESRRGVGGFIVNLHAPFAISGGDTVMI